MSKILIIINDAPYGTEKAFNALRIAYQLSQDHEHDVEVRIFLMADAVGCAVASHKLPNGYDNIERMLTAVIKKGAKLKLCGNCVESRGFTSVPLIEGAETVHMSSLTEWILDSDKVVNF